MAADKIFQAVSEQIPYLQQVVTGVDGGSPVALLEFQKLLGGGSLKELVALGASIVADAVKGLGGKDEGKEASAKLAEEEKPAEDEDSEKKEAAAKLAEEDEESEDSEKTEDEDSEETEDEDSEEGKEASFKDTFGYDLFGR